MVVDVMCLFVFFLLPPCVFVVVVVLLSEESSVLLRFGARTFHARVCGWMGT